ncbi:MAG: hypothetical protein U0526_00740 [Candidatus Saccharibacteria bacterium]
MPNAKLTSTHKSSARPTQLSQATIVSCVDSAVREMAVQAMIAEELAIQSDRVIEHPQVIWIELEKLSYGRDIIVQVLHELSLATFTPGQGRYVVFTQAQRLTPEAANSLLKVMEEPPPDVHFILLVDTVAHVMPTLRSRSHVRVLPTEPEEQTYALGRYFMQADVPGRIGMIAERKERADLQQLYAATLEYVRNQRDYASASWLMQFASYVAGSGNMRLLLEAFAVRAQA